ncbi:hypothetical protein, partial [Spirulina subsalsa]|uniref:hypothetical protein n=1 Tax=Spirulina subsalsa TaxID=54311 RepID=UPI00232EB7AA
VHPSYAIPHPTLSLRRGLLAPFSCGRRAGDEGAPWRAMGICKSGMHPINAIAILNTLEIQQEVLAQC